MTYDVYLLLACVIFHLFRCQSGPKALPTGYAITYKVDEPRRVTGGISTLVGTNEGSLVSFPVNISNRKIDFISSIERSKVEIV